MKFLRTEYAALFGMILILLATVKHAFEVYVLVMYPEASPSLWQSVYIAVMLIAIDFAVLLFTIHGNNYAAQTFAFLIFLVNLFAFWQQVPWEGWSWPILRYVPGLLFSGMFAYGLYYFTDVFSDLLSKHVANRTWQQRYEEAQQEVRVLEQKVQQLEKAGPAPALLEMEHPVTSPTPELLEKAEYHDLLLKHLIEVEGFHEKPIQNLKRRVDYWRRKQQNGQLDEKGKAKYLVYEAAYSYRKQVATE